MNYYYSKNEEKIGPLSLGELKKIELKKDTLVWYEGLDDWVKAEEVKELRDLFNKETKNKAIKETKRKITKNQRIILKNILISTIFYVLIVNPRFSNNNPFKNFDSFYSLIFRSFGWNFIFYIPLVISIFKRFNTKVWIVIIVIQWALSLFSILGFYI